MPISLTHFLKIYVEIEILLKKKARNPVIVDYPQYSFLFFKKITFKTLIDLIAVLEQK